MTDYPEGNPVRLPLTENSEQWEIDIVQATAEYDPFDPETLANEPNDEGEI